MMTFQDRERAFEAKFAHDEEFRFRVTARRDRLLAQWVVEQLHLSGPARAELVAAILSVRDGAGHDERLLRQVTAILSLQGGIPQPAGIQAALERCAAEARQLVLEGA